MATKAILNRRGATRSLAVAAHESAAAEQQGLTVEHRLPQGTLVSGDETQYAAMEQQGYRVKLLPDTNLIEVGSYRIDVEAAPPVVPPELEVPQALAATWPHHLVQLAAPPFEDWVRAIESAGVDVVEPISAYGLFVAASPEDADRLKELPFVVWVGPLKPAYRLSPNLRGLTGRIQYVNVGVYPVSAGAEVRKEIEEAGGQVVGEWVQPSNYADSFQVLLAELDAAKLPGIACLPPVRWLEHQGPDIPLDERSVQIVAEALDGAPAPHTAPVAGYQANLAALGLSGAGVTIGIVDTGVDTHDNAAMHPDLAGRMAFFVDASTGLTPVDTYGHGTHVAGIAVGNAASGARDPVGFLLGQGVAPGSRFGSVNAVATAGPYMSDDERVRSVVNNNGEVINNSWGIGGTHGSGYTARSQGYDQRVRDPNPDSAGLEYVVIVSAAGNNGPGLGTIGAPWEAKNPIVVGNSLNYRPDEGNADDIRGILDSSSRGPTVDGRLLPNVVAPGTDVISARSTVDASPGLPGAQRPLRAYRDTGGTTHEDHTRMSGTSMASPHVAGLCALLIEWWRNRTGGKNPSPALLKALLVNGAEDLAGGPSGRDDAERNPLALTNIPNFDQGWGRVSLENMVLQAPGSDRGPRIFLDQQHAFTANGQEHTVRVAAANPGAPLRVTLAWTDAAGAVSSNPALVNDLDLEVIELATGNIYRGNVFANGFSTTGGAFDNLNNVECVYVRNPAGLYEVSVIAANIAASARPDLTAPWQDFALVIDNADLPSTEPVSVVPLIDCSGSMAGLGFEEAARTGGRQLADLLGIDDQLGVVSFDAAAEEIYPASAPTPRTITGRQDRDSAKAKIDGLAFRGCTFMGAGILRARDVLAAASGSPAIVLLSDGWDNKGCQTANASRPWAADAVDSLPEGLPVHTCGMGPASDQGLLEKIARVSKGRYFFLPALDDQLAVYNYIRGHVTGCSVVANESVTAPNRVAAFVDAEATEAVFTAAWPGAAALDVRLRDPRGRLLHPDDSYVRRTFGPGYAVFKLRQPMPGQWYVELAGAAPVRCTVGGFVRSPLRAVLAVTSTKVSGGLVLKTSVQAFHGTTKVTGAKATAEVVHPLFSLAGLLQQYKTQLSTIQPPKLPGGDRWPADVARLTVLRAKRLGQGKPDLYQYGIHRSTLHETAPGTLGGGFKGTQQKGSYNVVVTVQGTSPVSNKRFVRRELFSLLAR